jgi:hypothetical protein|tara:strand:+ start:576 stop:866 length:291 start_codon:yes stop_codon:yes gene_type:complete
MSKIKVNYVTNKTEDGAVELSKGATVPNGKTLTVNGNATATGSVTVGTVNVNTATVTGNVSGTLSGDGSNLSNLPSVNVGKIMAIKRILGYDEFRA